MQLLQLLSMLSSAGSVIKDSVVGKPQLVTAIEPRKQELLL